MKLNPLTATDFYKVGHVFQYPPHTGLVYSNFTCRGDKWANVLPDFDHKAVFFGLQGVCQWLLRDLWNERFFKLAKKDVLREYKRRMDGSLPGGLASVDHVADLHDLGYLPVLIKALPEGSRVDMRVPMWTIRNTSGPRFGWVTNYLETQLSAECWKPLTSATTAHEYWRLISIFAEDTGASKEFVPWQGHDFSARGMCGIFDAAQCGAGHLLSFTGTDTIHAIDYLEEYYSGRETFVGGSIPATEHSVMCMGGEAGEVETIKRLITEVYPTGPVSIVSDTWDFWNVVTKTLSELKDVIMARDGKVVIRPDSGDPVKIVCGDVEAPDNSPQFKGAVQCLWDIFGGTETAKGYRTLDSHIGVIYGDSINLDRAFRIMSGLKGKYFASDNIVFGIGSYTYQGVTRDSFGTAIKATFGIVDGDERQLSKNPKTDSGLKKSARGLLRVEREGNRYVLYDQQTHTQEREGLLAPVFQDSEMMRHETLDQIRARLRSEAAGYTLAV